MHLHQNDFIEELNNRGYFSFVVYIFLLLTSISWWHFGCIGYRLLHEVIFFSLHVNYTYNFNHQNHFLFAGFTCEENRYQLACVAVFIAKKIVESEVATT